MEEAHGGRTRELIVLTSLVVLATCGAMSAERLPLSPQQRENSIATTTAATTEKMIYVKPSSSIMLKRSPQDAWPQPSQQGPASEGDFLLLNGTAAESMASSSSSSSLAPADHEAESAELGQQQAAPDLSSLQLSSQEYLRHSFTVSLILTVAYTLVFLIGLLGNSFVVIIVCKSARMRTVTNYFIANLAFADILVLLFCLPATLVSNLFIRKYPNEAPLSRRSALIRAAHSLPKCTGQETNLLTVCRALCSSNHRARWRRIPLLPI